MQGVGNFATRQTCQLFSALMTRNTQPMSKTHDKAPPGTKELDTERDFYERVHIPVPCPKRDFHRYASNCLASHPRCLKGCAPVEALLSDDMPLAEAVRIAREQRSWARRKREQEQRQTSQKSSAHETQPTCNAHETSKHDKYPE